MRICIWFETISGAWGGSNSFLRTLAGELQRQGHTVGSTPSPNEDVILVNSWTRGQGGYIHPGQFAELCATGRATLLGRLLPARAWRKMRRRPAIVHRVDGVAQLYGRNDPRADQTQFAIAQAADGVIFQSRFSQQSFASRGIEPRHSAVIHNAVDGEIYHPSNLSEAGSQQPLPSSLRLVMVSWSTNLRKGFAYLPPLAELPGVSAQFIGRWPEGLDPGKVQLLGAMQAPQIAETLRQRDALVHGAQNDPCPNTVLEALACGLPVLYHPSGGTPELASEFGLPLPTEPDLQSLASLVERFRGRYAELRQRTLADRPRFLIEQTTRRYLEAFQSAIDLHRSAS